MPGILAALQSAAEASKRRIKDHIRNPSAAINNDLDQIIQTLIADTPESREEIASNFIPGGATGTMVYKGLPIKRAVRELLARSKLDKRLLDLDLVRVVDYLEGKRAIEPNVEHGVFFGNKGPSVSGKGTANFRLAFQKTT